MRRYGLYQTPKRLTYAPSSWPGLSRPSPQAPALRKMQSQSAIEPVGMVGTGPAMTLGAIGAGYVNHFGAWYCVTINATIASGHRANGQFGDDLLFAVQGRD